MNKTKKCKTGCPGAKHLSEAKPKPKPKTKTKAKTKTKTKKKTKAIPEQISYLHEIIKQRAMENEPPIITRYIKKVIKGKRQKIGVLVGTLDKDKDIIIGWSKVNINRGDIFNKERGLSIALKRTKAREQLAIPPSLFDNVYSFSDRCHKYFKDAEGSHKIAVQISAQVANRLF